VRPRTAAYTNGLRGGLNQGRFDDIDTAHNADTDRQWHRHHHIPAVPHPQSPKYLIGSAQITKWSWAVRGSSCSICSIQATPLAPITNMDIGALQQF